MYESFPILSRTSVIANEIYNFFGFGMYSDSECDRGIFTRKLLSVKLCEKDICEKIIGENSLGDSCYYSCGVVKGGVIQEVTRF